MAWYWILTISVVGYFMIGAASEIAYAKWGQSEGSEGAWFFAWPLLGIFAVGEWISDKAQGY